MTRLVALLFFFAFAFGQSLVTYFSSQDLVVLEKLIGSAEQNNFEVLDYVSQLNNAEQSISFQGRLAQALTISAGANLSTNLYNQAVPSINLSLGIDVMRLFEESNEANLLTRKVQDARTSARVRTVEAFIAYKIAVEGAEGAARTLEASQAAFDVAKIRVETGDAVLVSQLKAQGDAASAALELLRANGEVIIALEHLAQVTGLSIEETAELLKQ